MAAPLLKTKLHIPPARLGLVPRVRLIGRLNAGLERKLTVVSAPAGFGKTTLLSEWLATLTAKPPRAQPPFGIVAPISPFPGEERTRVRAAWLALDEGDNDIARFLAYLITALQTIDPAIGQASLSVLRSPQAPQAEAVLTPLINEILEIQGHLVLVLDDYHLIESEAIHAAVAFLLDHLPPRAQLVIATRSDPPLPLARLRARGQLIELRQTDLRFTHDEAAELLSQAMEVQLSTDNIAALISRTEGWVAGLQMATLALQARLAQARTEDVTAFIQAFTGSNRYVLDYLAEEVFQRQPEGIQSFLLQTSLFDRLTAPLCDAVTAQADSQSTLEQLERANLFILPLDDERRWYRYHRLFADLLRKRLHQAHPDMPHTLHRRASDWYEQNGYLAEAIDHALSARDFERAAGLIEQTAETTLGRSEISTFLGWVDKLPDGLVCARPTLCLFHAWGLLIGGRPPASVEARLKMIDAGADSMAAKVATLRAYIAIFQGQVARAAELARQALRQLPESELFMRVNAAWLLGNTYVATGDFDAGKQAFDELARTSLQAGNLVIAVGAVCHLAEVHIRQAHLYKAQSLYEKALEIAVDAHGRRLPIAEEALIGLGELWREWNDLEAASRCTLEGIELARRWRWPAAIVGYITLARVRQAQGKAEEANALMEKAHYLAIEYKATDMDDLGVAMYQAQIQIVQGDLEAAERWVKERGLGQGIDPAELDRQDDYVSFHIRKYEYLVYARVLIAQGHADRALPLLEAVLARMEQQGRTRLVIETVLLKALAWQTQGDTAQALIALTRALSLAEPAGFVRLFVDEGLPMARLLHEAAARGVAPEYVARLLAAFPQLETPAYYAPGHAEQFQLVEPLSERELEVLQLLAAGLSNPEIARRLYVAVSTIRSHTKSIYGKLGAHRREEAVQRARELGLL
jgi:LuxR family maltose regulon positive regulatory protein